MLIRRTHIKKGRLLVVFAAGRDAGAALFHLEEKKNKKKTPECVHPFSEMNRIVAQCIVEEGFSPVSFPFSSCSIYNHQGVLAGKQLS